MFRLRSYWQGEIPIKRRVLSLPTVVSLAVGVAFPTFLVARFDVDLGAGGGRPLDWADIIKASTKGLGAVYSRCRCLAFGGSWAGHPK